MMKRIIWWTMLTGMVGVLLFALVSADKWLDNLFRKLDLLWGSVQGQPNEWAAIKIGGMDAMLYTKNLQVDVSVAITCVWVALGAVAALAVFGVITAWWHRRTKRTQPRQAG